MPRKRKPTHLKIVDGNPGKRKLEVPKAPPQKPTAPPHLSAGAKREWNYIVPKLDEVGLLTKADRTILEIYCGQVALYRNAQQQIDALGELVRGDKGRVVKNPAIQIARDAATQVRLLSSELGLTPAARERLALGLLSPDTGLDLDNILNG